MNVEMTSFETDVAYNTAKAAMTQGLLDVADGDRPALEIHTMMNETTKAAMLAQVGQTHALLAQLEGLQILYGLNGLLGANDNEVAFVYYTQLEDEPAGYDYEGSVKYHGEEAKKIDDTVTLMGTTVPIILFVIAVVLSLVGIALILAGPKGEPIEEESGEGEGSEEEGEERGWRR
mgnify:CR=1 FL=1